MSRPVYLGVDLGGTHLRLGRWSAGQLLDSSVLDTAEVFACGPPIQALARCILRAYPHPCYDGVGLGLPSLLDKSRSRVLDTPNLPGLTGAGLPEALQRALGAPVWLDRDVNMLLRYDLHRFQLPSGATVAGIYVGTGIGNALWLGDRMHYGKNGCAGELGHIPTGDAAQMCCCGNRGCAETAASGKQLARLAARWAPCSPLGQVFTLHGDEPWLKEFVAQLARPIAAEINILDPDYVVLGGGVLDMPAFPKDALERHILQSVRQPYPAGGLRLLYSPAGGLNGVYGAALYAAEKASRAILPEKEFP